MPRISLLSISALCVAAFIMPMDITIVSLALPYINAELHTTFIQQQLIIAVYNTAFTFFIIISGRICRNYNAVRVFMVGSIFFGIISALAGVAPSANFLIGARIIQGICGALVLISSTICVTSTFKESKNFPLIIATYTSAIGAGVAFGPFVGGILLAWSSWRWVFLINLPIMLSVTLMTKMAALIDLEGGLRVTHEPFELKPLVFLFLGTLLYFVGLSSKVNPQQTMHSFYLMILSLACYATFIIAENKSSSQIIEWNLFKIKDFSLIQIISFANGIAFWATLLFLPIFFQVGNGYTVTEATLAMLPSTLPLLISPFIGAKLASKFSDRKLFSCATFLLFTGNILLTIFVTLPASIWLICGQFMSATGSGLINSELTRKSTLAVSENQTGEASSANMAVRHLAFTIGVLILGFSLQSSIQAHLKGINYPNGLPMEELSSVVAAGDFRSAMRSLSLSLQNVDTINWLRFVYKEGVTNTLFVSTVMAFICLVFSIFGLRGVTSHGTRK